MWLTRKFNQRLLSLNKRNLNKLVMSFAIILNAVKEYSLSIYIIYRITNQRQIFAILIFWMFTSQWEYRESLSIASLKYQYLPNRVIPRKEEGSGKRKFVGTSCEVNNILKNLLMQIGLIFSCLPASALNLHFSSITRYSSFFETDIRKTEKTFSSLRK